jgi:hypothetical protein
MWLTSSAFPAIVLWVMSQREVKNLWAPQCAGGFRGRADGQGRRGERAVSDSDRSRRAGPPTQPVLTALDPTSPLSVGNGEFAFTADVTGLQTFDDAYAKDPKYTPLCTMSQWGWHSFPRPADLPPLKLTEYETHGRKVGYATGREPKETVEYLRTNPHRLHLGRIGFSIHTRDGRLAKAEDLHDVRQEPRSVRGDAAQQVRRR